MLLYHSYTYFVYIYIHISVAHVCFHQTHSPPLSTLWLYQALLPKRCGLESQWVVNPFITLATTQLASETAQKVMMVGFLLFFLGGIFVCEIPCFMTSWGTCSRFFPHGMVQLHTKFLEYNLVIFWWVGMSCKTKHWIGGAWGCCCFTQVSNHPIDTQGCWNGVAFLRPNPPVYVSPTKVRPDFIGIGTHGMFVSSTHLKSLCRDEWRFWSTTCYTYLILFMACS